VQLMNSGTYDGCVRSRFVIASLFLAACQCRQEERAPFDAGLARTLPCAKDGDCLAGEACACESAACSLPKQPANTTGLTVGLCIPRSDRLALLLPIRLVDGGWLLEATDASFQTQLEAEQTARKLSSEGFRGD
jgi:hypothetical protein